MIEEIIRKRYEKWKSILATAYLFELILGIPFCLNGTWCVFGFPFYFTNRYFHVLGDRTTIFRKLTLAYILAAGVCYLFLWVAPGIRLGVFKKPKEELSQADISLHFYRNIDLTLVLFLVSALISMAVSGMWKAVWNGSEGRNQGVMMWLLYAAAYFLISRAQNLNKKRLLGLFVCSGCISAMWGILDYAGADPLGWIVSIKEAQRGMFSSSYGNINTYTAGMILFFAVSGMLHIKITGGKSSWHQAVLSQIAFLLFAIALITGQSDNAVIGVAAFFAISAFVCQNRQEIGAYIRLCGTFCLGISLVYAYGRILRGPVSPYIGPGILLSAAGSSLCATGSMIAFLVLELFAFLVSRLAIQDVKTVRFWRAAGIICLASGVVGLVVLVIAVSRGVMVPDGIRSLVQFSDSWGTRRGMIWRLETEEYVKLSPFRQVFGTGLETFGYWMRELRYDDMKTISGQVFDSPHNELLQYEFTAGIAGTLFLYIWYMRVCIHGWKRSGTETTAAVAVLTYLCVSLVNISVPMTQVHVIMLLGLIRAGAQKEKTVLEKSESQPEKSS